METSLRKAGEVALEHMRSRGTIGEAFLMHTRERNIDVSQGQIETFKEAEQTGIGIRVIRDGRVGFAYGTNISAPAVAEVVRKAQDIAYHSSANQYNCLPEDKQTYPQLNIIDDGLRSVPVETKIELAKNLETIARSYDPRITLVNSAGYTDYETSLLVMNSHNLYAFGQANYCGLHISLAATADDEVQNGFAYDLQRKYVSLDPLAIGEEAAKKALRSLNGRTIASGQMPCIMDAQTVARFIGLLSASVEADSVQKGKSRLADKIGQIVAGPNVTLVDDATMTEGIASFPFDGEGVAARKNTVIDKGVLQGFLYDTVTANRDGSRSTGNAVRSFRTLPVVGTTNFMLEKGDYTPEELRSGVDFGIYITEIMGMHTANPITGDFSLGAAGSMIERDQLTYPFRGITIAGNVFTLLREVEAVGSDLRFFGGKAASSIRFKCLNVSGH